MDNILSAPSETWTGHTGHVNANLITQSLCEHLKNTGYTIKVSFGHGLCHNWLVNLLILFSLKDVYSFVCGPPKFNELAIRELEKACITKDQVHVFDG